ncbi:hypothetical protein [Bacillus sp. NPDC077027]|uniref:hypothetical protein n=1 Tax=Bacillus sp. NPDC077027 TaxID=3390548 RepID=UPI003D022F5E
MKNTVTTIAVAFTVGLIVYFTEDRLSGLPLFGLLFIGIYTVERVCHFLFQTYARQRDE